MMKETDMSSLWRIVLFAITSLLFIAPVNAAYVLPSFASAEHIMFGDNVKIYLSADDPGQANYLFHFPNGLSLTYGEIIAFGDFYGIPSQPISKGATALERKIRFRKIFNSFTQNSDILIEANLILNVIHAEKNLLVDGIKQGQTTEEVYAKIGNDFDRQLNCITGGGCDPDTWWMTKGRYLLLAIDNYDHFDHHAWLAYEAGHEVAMEEALIASQTSDIKRLELAYAMNAFACHFLSDRFSAGHMRTPREELPKYVTPDIIGTLLANYMHDEENQYGIHVHNQRGDHWYAYGDKSYFNPNNAMHRLILSETLQFSLDHIFAVYQKSSTKVKDNISDYIPIADEHKNAPRLDLSPLFYWDNYSNKLMRRENLANPYDRHWIDEWWGWSTLIELQKIKNLPFLSQVALAQSEFKHKALQSGLITDKKIIRYIN